MRTNERDARAEFPGSDCTDSIIVLQDCDVFPAGAS